MKECEYSKILPCYRDGYGVWHYSDDTHDKVYGLNKQMCDIGKRFSDPLDPISEECMQEMSKALEITRKPKDIMEEKKTKKMTKAEAFEWLKGKKVYANGKDKEVQMKLFECGVGWANNHFVYYDFGDYLLIETDGCLYHCGYEGDSYWRLHHFEEISVDDILSIEIVDENKNELEFNYDKVVELAKPLMHYLSETGHTEVISVCMEGISAIPMGTFLYKG